MLKPSNMPEHLSCLFEGIPATLVYSGIPAFLHIILPENTEKCVILNLQEVTGNEVKR